MSPQFNEIWAVFGRIGVLSFGGPAAQIALMHKELVEERTWLTEKQFLGALSFCMLLPGPEAMQLATYAGWRLKGLWGGVLAGALFVVPGALVILALASLYISFGTLPLVQAAFLGVKAAVVVVVVQALRKVATKALKGPLSWGLALAAFLAIYVLALPFPLIVALAAVIGAVFTAQDFGDSTPAPKVQAKTLSTILVWGALWGAPVLLVFVFDQAFLMDIALFFSKLAVVTFGGAYAVLAYMTQTVSFEFGWITAGEMMDALGLAETTPGPLILVTEFVGLLAGYRQDGVVLMLAAGALTLWCTFIPCFLWIFAAAPYVEWLLSQPRLKGALEAITASVVGVIGNLSLWFALQVLFLSTKDTAFGMMPILQSFDIKAFILLCLAAVLTFWKKMNLVSVLVICAFAGMLLWYLL
ncbi:chromate efflux transporter [Cognatishimia maritima]|uniref:Chromate transporter n=1 Tax=Cognatishimia maritima TaxID=870908 RepID=A0A1M5ILN1_9RHOB|nr:chromate efflux transporter [Cognatishimia maritima]SHG28830.1 chromate transporter [Cognatishimia maritima]